MATSRKTPQQEVLHAVEGVIRVIEAASCANALAPINQIAMEQAEMRSPRG